VPGRLLGAFSVRGAIRDRWEQLGWETGPLGYPTGEPRQGVDGLVLGDFQGGVISHDPATGDAVVRLGGR